MKARGGSGPHARTAPRQIRIRKTRVAGLLVVLAAFAVAVAHQALGSSSAASSDPTASTSLRPAPSSGARRGEQDGALGQAGGEVPDGTTVFADEVPGVANLDPALLGAVRRAATDAAAAGVRFVVNSGWRSPAYQEHLLEEAISEYGSLAEARRWVAAPDRSAHVSGDAVDIGPTDAASWLAQHGAAYGLCQVYANEPWHYELRPDAVDHGCPAVYADPTQDPRLQG